MDNKMSVGFTVSAGPLAQVSIEVASLRTAIQLATGAYGWFKGYERSQSLTQLLSANRAPLKTTSSFALERYVGLREEHHAMQGVVIENGKMRVVEMPKASTAISDIPGITCLRALTCCLLCLCTADATTAMLQQLIPYALVQHEMDDGVLEFEGPLQAGLKQWVSTVALEEESNKFKDYLLQSVDQDLQKVQTGPGLDEIRRATHFFDSGDEALILGVLKWSLTPIHQRETMRYPTRSLRAWAAAAIMSRLGFTVYPAYWTVNDHEDYKRRMQGTSDSNEIPHVFLAVSHHIYGDTDLMSKFVEVPQDVPLPRATPLLNIPWLAFRHVKYMNDPELSDLYLYGAYKWAFDRGRKRFQSLHVDNFLVKLEIGSFEIQKSPFGEHYKSLFTPFSPHIHLICAEPMQDFGPPAQTGLSGWQEWDFSNHEELFQNIRTDSHTPLIRNFYTTVAIVLGAMYGICSQACLDHGQPLGDDSEVVFNPDILYQDDCKLIRRWAMSIGRALQGKLGILEWEFLLFEMFVGAVDSTNLDRAAGLRGEAIERKGLVFGIQSHGFAAVSDVLVNLQVRPEALGYFHISRGQLLNLPVDNEGFVRGSTYLPFSTQIRLGSDDQDNVETLYRNPGDFPVESTRLDVEPCWEEEPLTVVLKIRQMGVPVASLNIGQVLERRSRSVIKCSCRKYSNEVAVPITEKWYHLLIQDLKSYSFGDMKPGKLANLKREDRNFLIDASQSEDALIYVLGIIDAHRIIIAQECLECAYQHYLRTGDNQRVVIVIPHSNAMVEDTEHQISERARVIDERR